MKGAEVRQLKKDGAAPEAIEAAVKKLQEFRQQLEDLRATEEKKDGGKTVDRKGVSYVVNE